MTQIEVSITYALKDITRPGFRHFPFPGMVVIDSKWVLRLDAHVGGQVAVLFEAPFQHFDRWSARIF